MLTPDEKRFLQAARTTPNGGVLLFQPGNEATAQLEGLFERGYLTFGAVTAAGVEMRVSEAARELLAMEEVERAPTEEEKLIREAEHVLELACNDREFSGGAQLAEMVVEFFKKERIDHSQLLDLVIDLRDFGVRFDLTPTMFNLLDGVKIGLQYNDYLKRIDKSVRERAAKALERAGAEAKP